MNEWETEIFTYFESRTNTVKLIKYRNYKFTDPKEGINFDKFLDIYGDKTPEEIKESMSNDLTISDNDNPEDNCYVVWTHETKLNGDKINEINEEILNINTKNVILISDANPTPTAIDSIKLLKSLHNIKIDTWHFSQTQLFAPEHEFVPPHRICTNQEKTKIANAYGLDIPKIHISDIMIKYLGATKGNVIEIIRPSETWPGHKDFTYRIVV